MSLDEFRKSAVVQEHLPKISDQVESMLVEHMLTTARASGGEPDKAQVEVGALKAIANLVMIFRAAVLPVEKSAVSKLRPLHRFDSQTSTPKT